MKKLLINIALFIVASILFIIISPIGLLYGILTRFNFSLNGLFISLAIGIDQLGNVFNQYLFDDILIKKNGVKFGVIDETISWTLGMNQKKGTLTKAGKMLCKLLDLFEKDHCFKSINKKK